MTRTFIISLLACCPATLFASDIISLSKPISENIKPDGVYWNFDEGKLGETDPNPVVDGSGNDFPGYLLPGTNGEWPVYVEGKFGTAIHLKGEHPTDQDPRVSWNALESPGQDETRLDLTGKDFTVGAWIKFSNIQPGVEQNFVICERGFSSGTNSYWSLVVIKSAQDKWYLRITLPGVYQHSEGTQIYFSDEEWHHVAMSLHVTEHASEISFWFDGQLIQDRRPLDSAIPPMETDGKNRIFTVGERNPHFHISNADAMVDDVFVTSGIYSFEP